MQQLIQAAAAVYITYTHLNNNSMKTFLQYTAGKGHILSTKNNIDRFDLHILY